jgi:hypothetical protein
LRQQPFGHFDHDTPGGNLHARDDGGREGQHHRVAARSRRDLQDISGAEIMNRDDAPDCPACSILGAKPDQVGMVELFWLRERQSFSRHIKVGVAQPFSGCTVGYTLKASEQEILGRPDGFNFEGLCSIGRLEGTIRCNRVGPSRERP